MQIIPAIDIIDKRVVRLERGEFEKKKTYEERPLLTARRWKEEGAKLIHVVDLEGARLGRPVSLDIIGDIIRDVRIDVELGGGLRTEKDIEEAFNIGVKFCVIGTSAVKEESFARHAVARFKDKVVFAVDVKSGKIAVKGWEEVSARDPETYVKELEAIGAKRIIYTDVSKDGMMSGPNLKALREVLKSTSMEVTVSGGISNIDDIKELKALEKGGLSGVIVGKALYENKINLKEALDAC